MTEEQQVKAAQIISRIGLCGCGSIDKYALLLSMLERAEALHSMESTSRPSFYDPMGDLSGAAVEFIADVMNSRHWNLLEHGTGVGGSWLTEDGKLLLQFFREHGTDYDGWPEWAQ